MGTCHRPTPRAAAVGSTGAPPSLPSTSRVPPCQVDTSFDDWKTTKWKDINVEQMDIDCKKFAKDVRSLDKEMKAWDAFVGLDNTVKNMMTSLRAVSELQNPAIRDRHWQQLMQATKVPRSRDAAGGGRRAWAPVAAGLAAGWAGLGGWLRAQGPLLAEPRVTRAARRAKGSAVPIGEVQSQMPPRLSG